jgi:hypothetical protein
MNTIKPFVALVAFVLLAAPAPAQETKDTRIGKLSFENGFPSKDTATKLYDEMDFQRACQAYLWGLPAVGLENTPRTFLT